TTLEQTFRNDSEEQIEAVYAAPVPPDATITGFAQLIDGQWVEAEVKAAEEAQAEFAQAAAQGQDAAMTSGVIVNAADPRLTFQTHVVLPPSAERSVRLTYTQVLTGEMGLTRYTYALSATGLSDEPVGDLLVRVQIKEPDEIRAVYSPSHQDGVEVSRPDATSAVAVFRAQDVAPDQDFELVYTQSAERFGLNLATYRDPKDPTGDGYFVLIAAPQLEVSADEVVQKDFVFILDQSGSMDGPKFEQAKAALHRILDMLNPGDRFTVIAFSTGVTSYSGALLPLDRRTNAHDWVRDLPIDGGTNINDAMLAALDTVDRSSDRPHIVVFLTDGQATEGVTQTGAILANVREAIRPQSRVYTIGIGDVNEALLESLAQENRGTSLFLDATGPIETALADYYAGINSPVLVDLALDFGDMDVYDMYPHPIPDMFLGGQVVLAGRFKGGGDTTITLRGNVNGAPQVATYEGVHFLSRAEVAAAEGDADVAARVQASSFVPRLWAQRKVDTLVRRLEIDGPQPDLIDEVRELGMQYQIVTPYTSFIVTDPNQQMVAIPGAGLPFLYADDFRTVNTALLVMGGALALLGAAGLVLASRKPGRHAHQGQE
ncbi:MAG: VWA domain-containing protein, partial [Anaerolineae bacterium]|nr:VWA domain-containing protein [Anaerolineae bacterium]